MLEEGEEKIGVLPDELRCRRSDGRQWRCKRRVVGDGKMCAYHLCRSNGKGARVGRVVERKEIGRVGDGVKLSVEVNGVVELGDGVNEERIHLDGEDCSVSNTGRKRKGVKRYGDGDDEDLSRGSKKGEQNVDESLKLGEEEVALVAEGCSVSCNGRKRKPVKRYGDGEEREDMGRGGKKKEGNVNMLSAIKNVKKDHRVVTVRRIALDEEMVPDRLRCIRTDGKRWRCSRRVKDGEKMCENHYIQGRLRQAKAVVPESLKLQRRDKLSLFKSSQIRVTKIGGGKKRRPVKWRQWSKFSETLDGALRILQLKKSDMELQLLKAYLKRRAEKLEMQQQFAGAEGYCQKEVTKDLPFGEMTISASPALQAACVAGTSSNLKIGSDPDTLSGVSFRSKNIEPVSIGSSKIIPGVKEMVKLKREKKRCHLCHKLGARLTKCSTCKKKSFCMECIKERYCTSRADMESCPVCCKQCSCEACLLTQSKDAEHENSQNVERRLEKVAYARKLIYLLLPGLKRIKNELRLQLELEENNKGKSHSEVSNQQVENSCNEQIYGENGKGCNVSTLCLNCSGDLTERLTNDADTLLSNYFNQALNMKSSSLELVAPLSSSFWKFGVNDGVVCCPPVNFDGCEHCLLVLRRVFVSKWINVLQENAEKEVSSFFDTDGNGTDVSSCRNEVRESEPMEQVQKASSRNDSNDNFLYYPSIKDAQLLEYFHKHWRNYHPIVVRNVLHQTPDLCWDPIFFFRSYLERCSADSADAAEIEASNCLNWCEVEIGIRQSYVGLSKGWNHANMWDETLKLKGCLSSQLFQNKFPDHFDGIVRSLPHQEYMNPMVGRSNLAVNIPPEVKPDLGPYVHISYGICSDSIDSMGMLCYNSYDTVNIMVHATEVAVPSEIVTQVRKLMEKKWSEYQEASTKMTSGETTPIKKGKLSKREDILKGSNLSYNGATACEGESGESCNSIVVHEPSGRSAANLNRSRESGSDSEASNLCSEKQDYVIGMQNFGNVEDADDDLASVTCSAEWDVFRRKDIPTLLDYLKLHSDKLSQPSAVSQNGALPVRGRNVFLEQKDKSRLKEEYGIEPWNFKQRVGEAVVIPAGCPFQIRALKSCVSVAFDFVSPECATSPIDLSKDLKLLSDDCLSKDKLEVKKMVLYNIGAALQQLSELNPSD